MFYLSMLLAVCLREGCGRRPQGGAQHGSEADPGAARPRAVRLYGRRAGTRPQKKTTPEGVAELDFVWVLASEV
jgi:hypothetical protein